MAGLSKPLYDRLLGAKYIFRQGVEFSEKGRPYSAGMAVLAFQDATEMVLRVVAEHLHAPIKENIAFNQLLDAIDGLGKGKLSHRSSLNQLNRARVNFKHFGLEPKPEDIKKFRGDLEGFFPNALSLFLGVEFHELSLVQLLRHRRSANWLHKAEQALVSDMLEEAARCSAVAFQLARRRFKPHHERLDLERSVRPPLGEVTSERSYPPTMTVLARKVEATVEGIREQLDILSDGTSLSDYTKFRRLTPEVRLSPVGTMWDNHGRRSEMAPLEAESALFCVTFAIDAILRMQDRYIAEPPRSRRSDSKYRAIAPTPLVVLPGPDPEVIRTVTVGEHLDGRRTSYEQDGYIAVWDDGEQAYVEADAVALEDPGAE